MTRFKTLNALMMEHDLKQSDLTEIGSQGVVSEILSDRRQLNVRQIKNVKYPFLRYLRLFLFNLKNKNNFFP